MPITKNVRFEARLTEKQKELLSKAADLQGRSLSDFVIDAAQQIALQTIKEYEVMELIGSDKEVFIEAISNPPEANDSLKLAFRRYSQNQKES